MPNRSICAWCRKDLGPTSASGASHGICDACVVAHFWPAEARTRVFGGEGAPAEKQTLSADSGGIEGHPGPKGHTDGTQGHQE